MKIPSYSTLLGEYTGTIMGILTYNLPDDVKQRLSDKLKELETISIEDIIAKDEIVQTGNNIIWLKHLNLTWTEWQLIKNNTVNNDQVFVNTLFQPEDEIKASGFNSEITNKRVGKNKAIELALNILRSGIKINFLDDSIKHIEKISPPLYHKYYKQS